MAAKPLPAHDPRTIARDIPGLCDALFPLLAQGIVKTLNRQSVSVAGCEEISSNEISASNLQKAMLFELAVAAAEQLIAGAGAIDWRACLDVAVARQKKHFDATIPTGLTEADMSVALRVARNLVVMLRQIEANVPGCLARSPLIPGYQWIASGVGDFSVGTTLIEVKCTGKHFSSSDYRQILMYWLLSYAAALERGGQEFVGCVLMNPRLNLALKFSFKELVGLLGAGKSKVELLQVFSSMVTDRSAFQ